MLAYDFFEVSEDVEFDLSPFRRLLLMLDVAVSFSDLFCFSSQKLSLNISKKINEYLLAS